MKIKTNIWFFAYLLLVFIIAAEVILRIYNPFPTGIKGNKIVLRINMQYELQNNEIPVLEKKIIHSKNSLGFRGPEKPLEWNKYFTIFTVGGSTTECRYLSDGRTWSDNLYKKLSDSVSRIWLNNAGFGGHSSFGHLVLLQDYIIKLRPNMVIMLVGINDVARDDLSLSDKFSMKGTYGSIASFFTKNSELANLLANIVRVKRAKSNHLVDTYVDLHKSKFDTLTVPEEVIQRKIKMHEKDWLPDYKKRLDSIVKISRINGIDPVLVTQPALCGEGIDSLTSADLEKHRVYDNVNGLEWWKIMEKYNDVTRRVALENSVFLIDLARTMPKSSLYFYDLVHFTNEGALKVSEIIYSELLPYIKKQT